MTPRLNTLDHLVLTVADIPATVTFYSDVLGMQHTSFVATDTSSRHAMQFGAMKINLHQRGAEFFPNAHAAQPGSADLCFLTETPLSVWQAHLLAHGVEIEIGPVPRTGATGPIQSVYIRDPDGNLIEISVPDLP